MPANLLQFKARGFDELVKRLEALTPLLRRKYVLRAMLTGAEVVRRRAAEPIVAVPVLSKPIYRNGKLYRKPGTLRDAISVRTSKDDRRNGDVGAFVNVRPARGSDRGANSPNDPFYWRFVEFGTKKMRARPFLRKGAQELTSGAKTAIEETLSKDFQQLNLPGVLR